MLDGITRHQLLGIAPFAVAGASQALYFQLHRALGGEAYHLAKQIRIGTLFQQANFRERELRPNAISDGSYMVSGVDCE